MLLRFAVLATAALLVCAAAPAQAAPDNDQTVVIGLGGGGYSSDADEVRGPRDLAMSHVYVEWYAFDTIGVGLRRTVIFETGLALIALGGLEVLSVQTNLLTANWVAWGGREYARVGIVAGLGNARYEYDGVLFFGAFERHVSTSGPAGLIGIYLDWGADGFGARLGYDAVKMQLDDVDVPGVGKLEADASGTGVYLDLRWAF